MVRFTQWHGLLAMPGRHGAFWQACEPAGFYSLVDSSMSPALFHDFRPSRSDRSRYPNSGRRACRNVRTSGMQCSSRQKQNTQDPQASGTIEPFCSAPKLLPSQTPRHHFDQSAHQQQHWHQCCHELQKSSDRKVSFRCSIPFCIKTPTSSCSKEGIPPGQASFMRDSL